jgi:hypothetical protein
MRAPNRPASNIFASWRSRRKIGIPKFARHIGALQIDLVITGGKLARASDMLMSTLCSWEPVKSASVTRANERSHGEFAEAQAPNQNRVGQISRQVGILEIRAGQYALWRFARSASRHADRHP